MFSNLLPSVEKQVNEQQAKQKLHHYRSRVKMRDFAASDSVSVRNMQGTYAKWIPGTVIRRLGPLTYLVKVGHRLRFVHVDHMLQAHYVDNATGVEPTLDEPTNVLQGAAREQQSVSPATTSQSCVSPATTSQSCVSPAQRLNRACVPQQRLNRACIPQQRLNRACLPQQRLRRACLPQHRLRRACLTRNRCNLDILRESGNRRGDSMCEGIIIPKLLKFSI